jgi:hypothetical protein
MVGIGFFLSVFCCPGHGRENFSRRSVAIFGSAMRNGRFNTFGCSGLFIFDNCGQGGYFLRLAGELCFHFGLDRFQGAQEHVAKPGQHGVQVGAGNCLALLAAKSQF